jgi:hypothetical protein
MRRTFTVLLGLRDPSLNYTRQIQIRFGATSWAKIQTEHPSLLTRIAATASVSLCTRMKSSPLSGTRICDPRLGRIGLTGRRGFSKLDRRQKDLNQAEDFSPLGFFASSRPAIAETTRRGNRKENIYEPIDSHKKSSSTTCCSVGLLRPIAESAGRCTAAGRRLSRVQHGRRAEGPL